MCYIFNNVLGCKYLCFSPRFSVRLLLLRMHKCLQHYGNLTSSLVKHLERGSVIQLSFSLLVYCTPSPCFTPCLCYWESKCKSWPK